VGNNARDHMEGTVKADADSHGRSDNKDRQEPDQLS
jgi:hypothetical protein